MFCRLLYMLCRLVYMFCRLLYTLCRLVYTLCRLVYTKLPARRSVSARVEQIVDCDMETLQKRRARGFAALEYAIFVIGRLCQL